MNLHMMMNAFEEKINLIFKSIIKNSPEGEIENPEGF